MPRTTIGGVLVQFLEAYSVSSLVGLCFIQISYFLIEPFEEVLLLLLHNKEPRFKVNLWPCVQIPPQRAKDYL